MAQAQQSSCNESGVPLNIEEIHEELQKEFLDFAHYNRQDPLDELLYIICSVKTTTEKLVVSYDAFRRAFPTYESIREASLDALAFPLQAAGLSRKKAMAIQRVVREITERLGSATLLPLEAMSDEECEKFLTTLPGVGKKVARCVMMYSLGRRVFPVDSNCWRIAQRLGWVKPTGKDGTCSPKEMDALQDMIPPELRFSLHVNMVSLGKTVCTRRHPRCGECPIAHLCPKLVEG